MPRRPAAGAIIGQDARYAATTLTMHPREEVAANASPSDVTRDIRKPDPPRKALALSRKPSNLISNAYSISRSSVLTETAPP